MSGTDSIVKKSLDSHSWIGLLVSVLMYIICLTGTLCVFYPEFQRWEKASIEESPILNVAALENALNSAISDSSIVTSHMYAYLPTDDRPFLSVANEEHDWYIDSKGNLTGLVESKWTDFLINMHVYLTIPSSLAIILVSTLGAMLCALIMSGLFAHPRIFKDAFKLRLGSGSLLQQVDIHNRLSVWGVPFYFLIAITGAYFGLVLPLLGAVSAVTGEDPLVIQATVFGEEPRVNVAGPLNLEAAFREMSEIAPEAEPFRLIVHNAGQSSQFFEIMASHSQRLIYSENYRFNAAGNYLGKVGFSDGEVGRQIVYSMYDLHFGHFAGYISKFIYGLLGLSLTVVSVTGINIWLRRRNNRDQINQLWVGVVWGVPLSLLIGMLTGLALDFVSVLLFWLSFFAALTFSVIVREELRSKNYLQIANVTLLTMVLGAHVTIFGSAAFAGAPLIINLILFSYMLTILITMWRTESNQVNKSFSTINSVQN